MDSSTVDSHRKSDLFIAEFCQQPYWLPSSSLLTCCLGQKRTLRKLILNLKNLLIGHNKPLMEFDFIFLPKLVFLFLFNYWERNLNIQIGISHWENESFRLKRCLDLLLDCYACMFLILTLDENKVSLIFDLSFACNIISFDAHWIILSCLELSAFIMKA